MSMEAFRLHHALVNEYHISIESVVLGPRE